MPKKGLDLLCRGLGRQGLGLEAGDSGGDGSGEFDGYAAVDCEGFGGGAAGEVGDAEEDGVGCGVRRCCGGGRGSGGAGGRGVLGVGSRAVGSCLALVMMLRGRTPVSGADRCDRPRCLWSAWMRSCIGPGVDQVNPASLEVGDISGCH